MPVFWVIYTGTCYQREREGQTDRRMDTQTEGVRERGRDGGGGSELTMLMTLQ